MLIDLLVNLLEITALFKLTNTLKNPNSPNF